MKLQSYILNGKPLTEYSSWSQGDINCQPFIVSNEIQLNYQDVSSITNWDIYGKTLKDFTYIRNQIRELTELIGFTNLTLEEKIISAKYFVVSKSDRDTVLNNEEQYDYWNTIILNSQISRINRWVEAKRYISYRLSTLDSSDLAKSTSNLSNDYINYNIITKEKNGVSGLFDYLTGEGDYELNGYPSKSYWTIDDQETLIDILKNGNY
jgi:hypothetical protein